MENNFEKLKIALRYFLAGGHSACQIDDQARKKYSDAMTVLEWAETIHSGKRKSGEPEFIHQVQMAHHVRSYWLSLSNPIDTIISSIVHDLMEDYPEAKWPELHSDEWSKYSLKLSKIRSGAKIPMDIYFGELSKCPVCSVVKGIDRINNLQSMLNVFSIEKQEKYIEEAETWIIPMIKQAKRNFPEQESVYENIKLIMKSQIELLRANIVTSRLIENASMISKGPAQRTKM